MAHIVKWKVNNLRWTLMWGKCTLSEEEKANVTSMHVDIPASWACSYTYTRTKVQVMVHVQYLWRTDIFSPKIILKIYAGERVKSSCQELLHMKKVDCFFLSWIQPRNKDWMRACSPAALHGSQTLHSDSSITYLLLHFYTTKKMMTSASWSLPGGATY